MITNGFDSDSTDNTYMIAMTMMKVLVLMMIMTPYNCVKGNNDSKKNSSKNKAKSAKYHKNDY